MGEAREFAPPALAAERALDRLILMLTAAMVPLGLLLGWSLMEQDPHSASRSRPQWRRS